MVRVNSGASFTLILAASLLAASSAGKVVSVRSPNWNVLRLCSLWSKSVSTTAPLLRMDLPSQLAAIHS